MGAAGGGRWASVRGHVGEPRHGRRQMADGRVVAKHWSESPVNARSGGNHRLGVPFIAALGSSLKWKVEGLEHLHFEGNGKRPIMAFWHGRVLTATYFFRSRASL